MSQAESLSPIKVFARAAVGAVYRARWPKFRRLLDHASQQQSDWLMERIRLGRETGFGRDHGFDGIHSVEDFRKRVPIADYAAFAPYVTEVANGNTSALIPPSEKLLRFTITTGSSGTPKLNPVTTTWLKQYRQAWDLWGLKIFADHPDHLGEHMLQLAGKWDMGQTPGGHTISMVSALLARKQSPMLRPFYAVPSPVNDIPDPIARYYTALRIAIVKRVGWIVLMNPGLLVRISELGDEHKALIFRDLRDGTLSQQFDIPQEVRNALQPLISKKRPRRAAELERMASERPHFYPKDYWGPLVVGCWLGGTAGFQKRALPKYFGDVPMRDMGLVSSEGRQTIPLEDTRPEGVPSIISGFYEYLPVEEAGSAQPVVVDGTELQLDRDYYLLMTTAGGFYRYNIGDVVRCRGHVGEAPLLEFIQKGVRCGDLEGEKLTEHQLVECAHAAAAELGVALTEVTAVPTRDNQGLPRYVVLLEKSDFGNRDAAHQFLVTLEQKLFAINFLYSARRRESVLLPARLWLLPQGTWARHIREETDRRGTGDYQYKHPGIVTDADWLKQFDPEETIDL
jgi:hypothetical protein